MVLNKRLPFLLFAVAVITTSVKAQLSVTITGTNGTCQSDASIKAGTKGAVAPITFELRNNSNAVIRPVQADSNFTGLPPATYKVAVYDANHPSVPVISGNQVVSTSYSALAINSVQPSAQNNLALACNAGSPAGYSYVFWSYTGKGPYTLSVLSGPTIPTPVQIPGGSFSGRIDNLSSGNYIFSVTDACNSTVSTNTVTVAGTPGIYPASFTVSVASFNPSSVTTCGKGLDIYMNVSASGGAFSSSVRMYGEFPANSGNFTDTVTNSRLNVVFSSPLTPAQINNASFNVWVQHPCTGAWQKSTFTVPDNSMAVSTSVPYVVPNNCDSITPYITVTFPRSNSSATTAVYCYPIRFTVAKATDPGTLLKDTSINSGGFSNYSAFYQPVTSGTYIVKLTDANGYQEQQTVVVTAAPPKKISYAATADPADCSLSSQYLLAGGNYFLQDGPYPVTLRLITATGLPDLSIYPPIVISSYPNSSSWINLWKIPLLPDNATVQIEATWACPRKDTGAISTVYLQKKYPYSSIKLDSSWYTIGSAGCSGNKANIGLRIAVKDTLGKVIPNYTGSFVIKVLSPSGIYQQYFSSGIQQNILTNISPGTYTIAVGPNLPQFTGSLVTCAYWDTIKVTVPVFGLPSINTTQTYGVVCPGQTTGALTIVANGYPPFQYAIRPKGASTFGSQQSSNIFPGLAPGYYDVQLQDGCNNIVVQTVQVIDLSANNIITVTGATTAGAVCTGNKVVLRTQPIGPLTSITWTLPGGGTSTADSVVINAFDASNVGAYSVVVVSAVGCTIKDTVRLTSGLSANLVITNPEAICTGSSIDLTNAAITAGSTNIASLSYYTNATATNAVANPANVAPTVATTYYIKAISADGCTDLKPVTVTVATKPTVGPLNIPSPVCDNGNLFITGGLVTPTVNNNSAPVTSSGWYLNGISFDPASVPFSANGKTLAYTVTNACGTTTSNNVTITVNAVPTLTPTGVLAEDACSNTLLTVNTPTITQNGLPVISAKWYLDNVEFNPATTRVTVADSGKTIKYEVTNACGANRIAQVLVVKALPVLAPITGTSMICMGNAVTLSNATPGGNWTSSNNSIATVNFTTGQVTGIAPGTVNIFYILPGIGGNDVSGPGAIISCPAQVSMPVTINPVPTVNAITNQTSCADNAGSTSSNIVAFTGSDPAASYNWTMTTNIGYVLSGTGDIPSFAYILPAGSPAVTSSVTVTPIANGCVGVKTSFNYTLNPYPQPAATVSNATQCLTGNNFSFTNTTSIPGNAPLTYQWNFDDGGTATSTNASHAFATAGDHTYTINATSDKGCSRSYTGTVSVKPQPTASFSYVITSPNTNDTYTFTNTSTSPSGTAGMSYYWDFGDGTFATAANPVHTYAADGSYTVKLTVTTADGCSASVSQVITIKTTANLIAGFTINNAGQCVTGNNFVFTNTSVVSGGVTITGYSWNFGDGGTSTAASPSHTYTAPGNYTVTLSVTSSTGFTDVVTQSVNVYAIPDVNLPASATVCNNQNTVPVLFSSTVGNPSYTWTNDNTTIGLAASGIGNIPSFRAINTGTTDAVATIIVTPTQNGCAGAAKTFTITVNPIPDVSGYTSQSVCPGATVNATHFTSSVTGATITYTWTNDNTSIGLAASGVGDIPSFTAINTGNTTQTANIRVQANTHCASMSYYFTIAVNPLPALTSATVVPGICSATAFGYSPTASPGGTSFTWSRAAITGIAQSTSSGTNGINEVLTNTTASPITVDYAYVLTTQSGCVHKDTVHVVVYPVPIVTPPVDLNVCNGGKVDIAAFNSNVPGVNYVWSNNNVSIGLGANGSGNIPSFTAQNASGTIVSATISVVAVANYQQFSLLQGVPLSEAAPPVLGCVSAPQDFTIKVNPSITANQLNDTTVCPGTQVTMPAFSSNGPAGTVYSWTIDQNIGLPLSGNGNIPVFTATNNTNAPVTANITVTPSVNTCASTPVIAHITVNPVITPAFTINTTPQCLSGNVFTFTNQTVPSTGVDYLWDFGDGTTSTLQSPTHVYLNAGTYTVTLNAVNTGSSCASVAFAKDVVVNVMPNASFIYSITSPNTNNSYQFTSLSSISEGSIASYAWDFGDGTTSTLQSPTHTYAAAGTYPVTLTVTSNNGCTASITQTVTVTIDPNLIAAFTINDNAQCIAANSFLFTNTSTISNGALITGYLWDFGDGTTSIDQNPPVHVYATAGNYVVKLTVTSNTGYSDIAAKSITVYPTPEMEDPANVVVCSGSNTPVIRYKPIVPGLTFTWTNDHPEIGLAASGEGGSIASFTATNTTNAPIIATITVVPHANSCDGIPQTFTITVNPIPNVSGYTNLTPCAGNTIFPITFTSNVSGATFSWSNNNSTIGIPASGSGNLPSVTALNNGTAPVVATITVTPQANACAGTPQTFTITVNPLPVMTSSIAVTAICSGATFHYTPQSSTSGVTFSWSRAAVTGISNPAASGTGDPNEVLVNTTAAPLTVNYVYSLTANGCNSAATYTIPVTINPAAALSSGLTPPAICDNTRFSYIPASATTGAAFAWARAADAYNAAATGTGNPFEVLHNGGTTPLTVTYTYTNGANSCTGSTQNVQVIVNPTPNDDFTANGPQCLNGNNFAFTLSPNSGAVGYAWDFGDGTTATGTNPSHSYTIDGLYPVGLTITSAAGCTRTVQHLVLVQPSPVAQFVYSTIAPNSNDEYQFTNQSIIGSGALASYNWDFGDGNTSTAQNPTHAYTASGTYTITLTVTSVLGCSATVTQTLIVNKDPNIIAGFTINNASQCISGNSFVFTDATSTAAGITITGYTWDFGDGTPVSNLQNPTHNYATAGSYVVKQHVTGTDGVNSFIDDVTQTVIVFATPDMVQPGNQAVCNQAATAPVIFKPIQPGLSFNWTMNTDIGGGTSGSGNIASFTANNAGNASVTATVSVTPVANGCSGAVKTFSIVVNPTPTVSGYANQSVCAGSNIAAVNFTSNVSGATYTWINNNTTTGIAASGNNTIPSTTGVNSGIAPEVSTITVVPSANGCNGTAQTFTVTVNPVPVMTSSTDGGAICSGTTFHYTPQSTTAGASFSWSRATVAGITEAAATGTGDPNETLTNTTALPIIVTYVYTVNANTCNSAATYSVQAVVNPAATLSSALAAPAICSGNMFSYLPTSATPGTGYNWSRAAVAGISNAAASGTGNPNETLINTTNLPITVTYAYTLTANGCTSVVQNVTVVVNPLPTADFTINLPIQCLSNNNYVFTNTSSVGSGTLSYAWNLDDGTAATTQDVTHVYQAEGVYNISLTTTTSDGCSATVNKTVQVNPSPVAGFTYNITSPNSDDTFQFTNTSIISSGLLTSYLWDFGDNSSSTGVSPQHIYATDGTYTVMLIVTSALGCTDVTTQNVIVSINPNIVPGFTINNATQCVAGNNFIFTNTTTARNPNTLIYSWNFGDGPSFDSSINPTHTYTAPGVYIITLTVTGPRGYIAQLTQSVVAFPTPTVLKPLDQTLCNGTNTRNINFVGGITSTTFNWTNDHPEIGLPATGSGNILSFKATNTTNVPVVATITVTPVSNGCSGAPQTFTITVNPTPDVDLITSQSLCAGQSTTAIHFTGNVTGTTFRWLNNDTTIGLAAAGIGDIPSFTAVNNNNTTSTATIVVAPSTATCFGTAQRFTINVNPVPSLTSTTTAKAICDSAVFNYQPSSNVAGTVFNWSRAAVAGISNASATGSGNPNELLDNTTPLPVQVTYAYILSANGCNSTAQNVTVTVNPRPKLTSNVILPPICDSTQFGYTPTSSTPATAFDWIRVAVPGISNPAAYGKDNPNEILDNNTTVPVNVTYAYTLSADKCYNTYNVNVTVNPKLALAGNTTPTPVCSGSAFQYTPSALVNGITYTWSRAAVAGISNPALTGAGSINETLINTTALPVNVTYVYTLSYNGCTAAYNVTVTVNPPPSLTATPADQAVCAGESVSSISLSGPVTGTNYNWTNSNTEIGLAASGTGTIASFIANNPHIEAIGGRIVVDPVTPAGCKMATPATFVILVNATPGGNIAAPLGTTVCSGSAIPLIATGGATYQWYKDGSLMPGATNAQLAVVAAGTYTVSAVTSAGCSVQQAGNVKVAAIQKPKADFDFSGYCINVPVTFTDRSTTANSGLVNYLWTDNAGNTSTAQSPVITYTQVASVVMKLKVTPQLCPLLVDSLSKTLAIEAPQAGQTLLPVNTTANAATQLNARDIGNNSYLWAPSTGLNNTTIQNPVATLAASQQYRINMGMPSGCTVTDTLQVSIRGSEEVFIPNMITPNGDGKNDQLIVVGIEKYPNSTMLIFNRWGNQVYRNNNYDNKWDGNGLAEGTYFYVLKLRLPSGDEKEFKGWVLLNRGQQ